MAKTPSQNRIRSTEALAARTDLTSLRALDAQISGNLLNTMTVIDVEDFPKIQNIQNVVSNKTNDVQNLIIQQVNNYNQHLQTYESVNNQLNANGWSTHPTLTPTLGMTPAQQTRYSTLFSQATTAYNSTQVIANIPPTLPLDSSALPTFTTGTLHGLNILSINLAAKNAHWDTIVNDATNFNINATITPVEGTGRAIGTELFNFGQQPTGNIAYNLYNPNSSLATVGPIIIAGTSTLCYQIHFDNNGTKTVGYIPQTQIAIDPLNGQLRIGEVAFPHNLVVYDATGRVVTPTNDFTLEIYAGVSYDMHAAHPTVGDFTGLNLVHTKPLTIKRSSSSFVKQNVLNNPAFTTELNNRMAVSHRQHIVALDNKKSQIYESIRAHLEKHPDYAALSDHQKEELYHTILNLRGYETIDPTSHAPVSHLLFGGQSLGTAITPTQAYDISTLPPTPTDHSALFATYVQSKDVEPKPTPADTKDEITYRNWLTRNLTSLTKNYIANRLSHYLDNSHITQAVNDAITHYTTHSETTQLDGIANIVPNINLAARALRACQPRKVKGSSWTRLLTGKGAEVSDTITKSDGGEFTYTTALNISNMPAVSATITIDGKDPVIYHGATPGDLLAKLLTGGGARIDGHSERLHIAFGTMKALIKANIQSGVTMVVPINQTNGDELRMSLDKDDKLTVERYNYNAAIDDFELSTTPGDSFDEHNVEHKSQMTHSFLVRMNQVTNTIMDRQYANFQDTMSDASSNVKNLGRWMIGDRERMSYKANPKWLRGLLTKWINRKQPGVEAFSFPIQSGGKNITVNYDPNGVITLEADGKTRKGKNLAKLLNPSSMTSFWGVFNKKKNFTDGFEMPIMQGLYDGLSRQLMQNERVNAYTYLVRDPMTKIMYTMYQGPDGNPKIGIIENVSQNIGTLDRTRDMLLMDWQKWGRTKGVPPQAIRELNEQEQNAVMSRPEIMDGFMQNMLKAREEILHIPVGGYRGLSLNATNVGRVATIGGALAAIGGVDLASGGLLSSSAYTAGLKTTTFVTGTAPHTLGSVTTNAASGIADVLKSGVKTIGSGIKGLYTGIAA